MSVIPNQAETTNPLSNSEVLLQANHFRKVYYPTVAIDDVSISIRKGDILALVGANGAGKSTLIKSLSGVIRCDRGELLFDGKQVDLSNYSPAAARKLGIRVVHQELSLCKNLTVYENFYIEQSQAFQSAFGWRKQARELAKKALDRVFPNHNIDVNAGLASLSIAQQQMVEIARATCDENLRLMILDEPTSSLPVEQTEQLQDYLMKTAREGMTYIYISHRLKEITTIANRVFIMQNGNLKWEGGISDTSEEHMVRLMGESIGADMNTSSGTTTALPLNKDVSVRCDGYSSQNLRSVSFEAWGGQILGLAGLEGSGQLEVLQEIFRMASKHKKGLDVQGKVAYVAGDRKKEGIFPLWSITDNQVITKAANSGLFKRLSKKWLEDSVDYWYHELHIKSDGPEAPIVSLSGGNQQKVLIARALVAGADIILLDDPTRGVDQPTKDALYDLFRKAAADGKLVIWRTSDDAELDICTDILVMNGGQVVGSFHCTDIDHEQIMSLAFQNTEEKSQSLSEKKKFTLPHFTFALIGMVLIYVICGIKSPMIFQKFGFQLMAVGFAPLVFAVMAQTYIIGLGHVDLGIGAFSGLVNVICCTVLYENPAVGIPALAACLLAYVLMGFVICKRNVPAIIVTLGMSFVWSGIALSMQAIPGGTAPEWLRAVFYSNTSFLNTVIYWMVLAVVVAIFIFRSRYGTVLRGFGNNESALINSGWSRAKAYMTTYLIAGGFGMLSGVATSAINNASDYSAASTYTMLSVASVIIGGGYFSGGVVTHFGAFCGAVIMTMISVLLGLFRVSTDYTASIQGLVLILILSVRLLKKKGGKEA